MFFFSEEIKDEIIMGRHMTRTHNSNHNENLMMVEFLSFVFIAFILSELLIRLLFSPSCKGDRSNQKVVWVILHSKKARISQYDENIAIVT